MFPKLLPPKAPSSALPLTVCPYEVATGRVGRSDLHPLLHWQPAPSGPRHLASWLRGAKYWHSCAQRMGALITSEGGQEVQPSLEMPGNGSERCTAVGELGPGAGSAAEHRATRGRLRDHQRYQRCASPSLQATPL